MQVLSKVGSEVGGQARPTLSGSTTAATPPCAARQGQWPNDQHRGAPVRQHAAPPQPAAVVPPHAMQAAKAARADAAIEQSAAEAQRQSAEERA